MNRQLREEVEMLRGMLAEQANGNGVKVLDAMDATSSTVSEKHMTPKGPNGRVHERRKKPCKSSSCGGKEDVKPALPSPKTSTPEKMESYTMSPMFYDYSQLSYPSPPGSTHPLAYPTRPHPGNTINQPTPLIPAPSPQYQQLQHPPLIPTGPTFYYHPPLLPQTNPTSVPHPTPPSSVMPALLPSTSSTSSANPIDDTSSCLFAAHIINSMRSEVNLDQVKDELGCGGDERCDVDNKVLFGVMDRYG